MRKALAALLALCVVGTSSLTALATGLPDVPDVTVGEQQTQTTPEAEGENDPPPEENEQEKEPSVEEEELGGEETPDSTKEVVTDQEQVNHTNAVPEQEAEEWTNVQIYDMAELFRIAESTPRPFAAVGDYFGEKLNSNAKKIYDGLVAKLEAIVENGTGTSMLEVNNLNNVGDNDAFDAVTALLMDHPELTFWVSKDGSFVFASTDDLKNALIIMPVIEKYRDGEEQTFQYDFKYYNIDVTKGDGGLTLEKAIEKATEVFDGAKNLKTDYDKVAYFNKEICKLTTYNDAALEPNAKYDDSFQFTNVFLGQPAVCEGYAKAFKYLCDKADIGCYLVEGVLQADTNSWGNHMWNYVELDNEWYVVDVTNNDSLASQFPNYDFMLAKSVNNEFYKKLYDSTRLIGTNNANVPTNNAVDLAFAETDYVPGIKVTAEVAPLEGKGYDEGFGLILGDAFEGTLTAEMITIKAADNTAPDTIVVGAKSGDAYPITYGEGVKLPAGKVYTVTLDLGKNADELPYTAVFAEGKNTFFAKATVNARIVADTTLGNSFFTTIEFSPNAVDLTEEGITIRNEKTGKEFHPLMVEVVDDTAGILFVEPLFLLDRPLMKETKWEDRLEPGTYTVSIPGTDLYDVTFTDGDATTEHDDQFTVLPRYDTPAVTFEENEDGSVTATATVANAPEDPALQPALIVLINDTPLPPEEEPSTRAATNTLQYQFTFDRDTTDAYLTKEIALLAVNPDEDVNASPFVNGSFEVSNPLLTTYVFKPAEDEFQVIVTPRTNLKGKIEAGTVVAELSTKNETATVSYAFDSARMAGLEDCFIIDQDGKIKIADGWYLDANDEVTLYVVATDGEGDGAPIAYGQATVKVGEVDSNSGGHTGGASTGGGSGSSSSSTTTPATPASKPLTTADAAKAAADVVKKAPADSKNVDVVVTNVTTVAPDAFKAMADEAAKSGKQVRLLVDTVKDGKILARVYVDAAEAAKLSGPINLAVSTDTDAVVALFGKYFRNEVAAVKLEQKGSFGMTVQVAVKLDLSKLDVNSLVFYSYDAATNTYARLEKPAYYLDTAGYLHFNTNVGGTIIITDGALAAK